MEIKEVKDLIQEVLRSDISEFELEHTGTKIRLKRGLGRDSTAVSPAQAHHSTISITSSRPIDTGAIVPSADSENDAEEKSLHIVTSPIVGTFYRAPNPEAEPYVNLGDPVHEGMILCLVEAMKLMNEIPADIDGEVARIYIENGHPVEFGQKLFGIRPRSQD
jgi:acetyl-CoA carboxylase biotin carboxyl carrier protein